MSADQDHGCEVSREEFLALRSEMEASDLRQQRELGRLRQRVRELEKAIASNAHGAADRGQGDDQGDAKDFAGDCPECEAVGGLCISCERHLDAQANAYGSGGSV